MLSIAFYLFYTILVICGPAFVLSNKNKKLILFCLLATAQFNVTSFFKIGVTLSFFELSLIVICLSILLTKEWEWRKVFLNKCDFVFLAFFIISIVSIVIAWFRIHLGNLYPDPNLQENPTVRSLMNLNRFFLYVPGLLIVRNYLVQFYDEDRLKDIFFKYLAWSGIAPALAVVIQYFSIGFILIHNNPSFSETFRIVNYIHVRPVGLTNEASFFSYLLFFPFLGLYYSYKRGSIKKRNFYFLAFLFILSIVLSLSRTGLLIFFLFIVYRYVVGRKISLKRILLSVLLTTVLAFAATKITVSNADLYSRFVSSFQVEADLSTIERYGSMEGLINLGIHKSKVFGIGVYNYQFYVKRYLPEFMNVIHYQRNEAPPSFNFILQLIVEFGPFLFLVFFLLSIRLVRYYNDLFIRDWFGFLFLFALSFQILNFSIPFVILLYPAKRNMAAVVS